MNIPTPLRALYNAWMKFSHVLGVIMSTILLTVLWIVGFGLYAIVLRVMNMFFLLKKQKQDTYWKDALPTEKEMLRYPF